jgi:NAD(P)-dependent dehydrogenase (short-subunit alcohol dehydrogenase family)
MAVLDTFSLDGKVALVTGGAGLYGRQIVAALAEAGAKTFIAARGLDKLEAVAADERSHGRDVTALSLDLSSDESIEALHRTIIERAGRCDVLVNNAVTRSALDGWAHDLDDFDRSLRVNASALFKITQLFGQTMRARKSGSVINIGSMMGMVGLEMANYAGTNMMPNPSPIYHYEKGGMISFTRWAASILGADNVRVNCVSPGGYFSNQPAPFVRAYSERTQLGRMANDTDLKGIIVFLASDASAYITGTNIPVDGGYTAK